MNETSEWVIHTDGGARGNPGPAAYAYTIERPGEPVIEENGYLGETTNNVAEYEGLVHALEHARRLGGRRLRIHSDSELMVRQLTGAYKVKNPGLRPLFEKAEQLLRSFDHVSIRHIRRENNTRADRLANAALDAAAGIKPRKAGPSISRTGPARREDLEARVRDDCLACLHASAAAWAQSRGAEPAVEHVWDQLWSILTEANVLKPKKK